MMSKNEELETALEHVDLRRRGFLGKLLSSGAAFAALPLMSTVALADIEEGDDVGQPGRELVVQRDHASRLRHAAETEAAAKRHQRLPQVD